MRNRRYPNLFSSIKIGPLTFKNRIVSAPTSLAELSPEGHLTRDNIAYYNNFFKHLESYSEPKSHKIISGADHLFLGYENEIAEEVLLFFKSIIDL